MKRTIDFVLITAAILATLMMSAVWATPAYADDGSQPPADSEVVDVPPATEPSGDEAVLVEEVAPAEESDMADENSSVEESALADESNAAEESTPADETAPAADSSPVDASDTAEESTPADAPALVEDAPSADATLPEVLDQLPEGTAVVVTDENGAVIPLATEAASEAIDAIDEGDPMWCPVGVTPGGAGCTTKYTKFNGAGGLLASIKNKTAAGVIWVAYNYNSSGEGVIELNPTVLGTTANYALTIQGGWSGNNNTTITDTPSTFTFPLSITDWSSSVTIKDIKFTVDGSTLTTGQSALTVVASGNIWLEDVTVEGSDSAGTMGGASLNNTSGTSSNYVVVYDSSFNGNEGKGLYVRSKGGVYVRNLAANWNGDIGADLDNTSSTLSALVSFIGSSEFNGNTKEGLKVSSAGAITLNNVTANDNTPGSSSAGAYIVNTASTVTSAVTLNGTNFFMGNTGSGLMIISKGNVTTYNLNASFNSVNGADLNNNYSSSKYVYVGGTNDFSWNASSGLVVESRGIVYTDNITANNNSDYGAYIDNSPGTAEVNIRFTNYFSNNGSLITDPGLMVLSHGAINANNINALGNAGAGAHFDNCDFNIGTGLCSVNTAANVTLTGVSVFRGNGSNGLDIDSLGSITMYGVTSGSNGAQGAVISNAYLSSSNVSSTGYVYIPDYGVFNLNATDGLYVTSKGGIYLVNATASSNGNDGAYLRSDTGGSGYVTLIGVNEFSNNGHHGLSADTNGAISVSNLTANGNGSAGVEGRGASLDNTDSTLRAKVDLTGYVNVNYNYNEGLYVLSDGSVTAYNVTAARNGLTTSANGVHVVNNTSLSASSYVYMPAGTHTLLGNGNHGLYVNSYGVFYPYGNMTVNNNAVDGIHVVSSGVTSSTNTIAANFNNGYGAYIDANNGIGTGIVELKGVNTFLSNKNTGLWVDAIGAINLNKVTADRNDSNGYLTAGGTGHGVYLDNHLVSSPANVTITSYVFTNDNPQYGLYIKSKGAVTVTSATSTNNGDAGVYEGIYIDNTASGSGDTTRYVYLPAGTNVITGNSANGLKVLTYGGVYIYGSLTANENQSAGVVLGDAATGSALVDIRGRIIVSDNTAEGLILHSYGAVTSTAGIYANHNGVSTAKGGVYITTYVSGKNISLTGYNTFTQNGNDGLHIEGKGSISVQNVAASKNTGDGADLTTTGAATDYVYVYGRSLFYGNTQHGLTYVSTGASYIYNVESVWNGTSGTGRGINGTSVGAVTMYCVRTYGNVGAGYYYNITGTSKIITSYGWQSYRDNTSASDPNYTNATTFYKYGIVCP